MKHIIILFCLAWNVALSQNTLEGKKNEITQYLEYIKNDYNVPGMVVAISNKDGIEYIKSFGNVSTEDNFIIGSNSKAFTALIILRLQENGLLNINEPVVKYLPWFEYENKEVSNEVTIKNLLNHTSGQPTEIGRIFPNEDENAEDVRLKIVELLKAIKVDKYPIKDFDYSNTNYQLLGYIIEKITSKEYSEILLTNYYGESASLTGLGVLSILLDKKPTKESKVFFYITRSQPFLVLFFLIIFTAVLKKWYRNGKPMGVSRKILPNIFLSIGIIIALGWTFYIPSIFRVTIKNLFQFDITSGFSLILLTIFTLGISFLTYFNRLKKTIPNKM